MGADASKSSVVVPLKAPVGRSSFRVSRKSQTSLVECLLQGKLDSIDLLITLESRKAVCVKLANEQQLWVLPIHVACAVPDTPWHVIESIVNAYPEGLLKHTTFTEDKLKSLAKENFGDAGSTFDASQTSMIWGASCRDTSKSSIITTDSASDGFGAGWLPIHIAVWYGTTMETIRYIVSKIPNCVYCKTSQGFLPLHLACMAPTANECMMSALVEAFPAAIHVPASDGSMAKDLLDDNILLAGSGNDNESLVALVTIGNSSIPGETRTTNTRFAQSIPSARSLSDALKMKRGLLRKVRKRKTDNMRFKLTKLFKYIALGDWKSASDRLAIRAYESGVWTLTINEDDPPCHMLPLHLAIRRRAPLGLVREIVQANPEAVCCREFYGMLPLHLACSTGSPLEIVDFLWERNPTAAQVSDSSGMLPLHLAAEKGSHALVLFLLEAFPSGMTVRDNRGYLPLEYVERSRSPQQNKLQAEFGRGDKYWAAGEARPDSLVFLIGKRKWDDVLAYLEVNPDEASRWTKHPATKARYLPIHYACKYRATPLVLEELGNIYPQGLQTPSQEFDMLPIHLACQNGASPEMIETLLRLSPDTASAKDVHGLLPLHLACSEGTRVEVVEKLLQAYPKASMTPDRRGMTPRTYAEASIHPHTKKVLRLFQEVSTV